MKTGVEAFKYAIRMAILPVVFIFNPELLLVGVGSVRHAILVFVVSLVFVVVSLFRRDFVLDRFSPAYSDAPMEQVFAQGGTN